PGLCHLLPAVCRTPLTRGQLPSRPWRKARAGTPKTHPGLRPFELERLSEAAVEGPALLRRAEPAELTAEIDVHAAVGCQLEAAGEAGRDAPGQRGQHRIVAEPQPVETGRVAARRVVGIKSRIGGKARPLEAERMQQLDAGRDPAGG